MTNDAFDLAEAVTLMDRIVTAQTNTAIESPMDLGVISGVLTLNDEIEVVVRFADRLEQFSKTELYQQTRLIETSDAIADPQAAEQSQR
ncbi:MAG: hypothetical protein ACJAWL_002629 [Motiliproteus sp.]|jgi:hypothetical protein